MILPTRDAAFILVLRRLFLLGVLSILSACQTSASITCGDLICPEGTICTPDKKHCVLERQLQGCENLSDGTICSYSGEENGVCINEICLSSVCGDAIVDLTIYEICDDGINNADEADASCRTDCKPQRCGDLIVDFNSGEDCDDGNLIPGDGCSGACIAEVCGNNVVDLEQVGNGYLPSEECDDGFYGLSHDGCSSTCLRSELPLWQEWRTGTSLRRSNHATAYDVTRGKVILFGGRGQSSNLKNNTWEWDETITWQDRMPTHAPSGRWGHKMSYDILRDKIILFGGSGDSGGLLNDTWEWDGNDWTQLNPMHSPVPRTNYGMSYDAARGKVILFGGTTNTGMQNERLADTWEWDGLDWTQLSPNQSPSPRSGHSMSYDPIEGKIILFGGAKLEPVDDPIGQILVERELADTWEWDGQNWTALTSPVSPSPRTSHAISFHAALGKTILYGGISTNQGALSDTWQWDGTGWTESMPSNSPSSLYNHAMIYHINRSEILLFGGTNTASRLLENVWAWDGVNWTELSPPNIPNPDSDYVMSYHIDQAKIYMFKGNHSQDTRMDTWEWSSTGGWRKLSPPQSPTGRSSYRVAYDISRAKTVLFGGRTVDNINENFSLNDIWEWDGTNWTQQSPTNIPQARYEHDMSYDAVRKKTVLFGGYGSEKLSDTWEWDGTDWTQQSPAHSPPPLASHSMSFDAVHNKTILFGGHDYNSNVYGGTWEWDGIDWTQLTPNHSPTPRTRHRISYHPVRRKIILFAGYGNGGKLNDTWEWDGDDWTQLMPRLLPTARDSFAMAHDNASGSILLFGGQRSIPLNDTWHFQFALGVREHCPIGHDGDRDGLIGCNDPDCWGYCKPQCPPHSTPDWPNDCDTALPHCGDGVCNDLLESFRLCPEDCDAPVALCGDFFCDTGESLRSCPGDCTL